jgi:hypothetical protein
MHYSIIGHRKWDDRHNIGKKQPQNYDEIPYEIYTKGFEKKWSPKPDGNDAPFNCKGCFFHSETPTLMFL